MRVSVLHFEIGYEPHEVVIHRALARRLVESIRKHMDCEIVQMSDPVTPNFGADHVCRLNPKGMFWSDFVLTHRASQPPETLFLDTDCVVQEDLSKVFDNDFDVALTFKSSRFACFTDEKGVKHLMPFNGGVSFSRKPEFWSEILSNVRTMTEPLMRGWWGGQVTLSNLAQSGRYKVHVLDAERYNYTPKTPDEDLSDKAIVHYKGGHRKHWNLSGEWKPIPKEREVAIYFQ